MKRWRSILLTILALLLVVPLVMMMWPEGPLDLSKDEEPFRSMVLPPKSVSGMTFEDGEVVGMSMTDRAGFKFLISFPDDYNTIVNSYPNAFSVNSVDLSSTQLKNPGRAKTIVVHLLRNYGKDTDGIGSTEGAIRELSPPISDVPSRLFKRVKRQFK